MEWRRESICRRSWLCPKALASLLILLFLLLHLSATIIIVISPSHFHTLSFPSSTSSSSTSTATHCFLFLFSLLLAHTFFCLFIYYFFLLLHQGRPVKNTHVVMNSDSVMRTRGEGAPTGTATCERQHRTASCIR